MDFTVGNLRQRKSLRKVIFDLSELEKVNKYFWGVAVV
jgi:hypothetical protein